MTIYVVDVQCKDLSLTLRIRANSENQARHIAETEFAVLDSREETAEETRSWLLERNAQHLISVH